MAEEGGWRALWIHGERGRECVKEAAARAALKGGRGPRGAGGGSATLEGGEEAAARLWRAGSWRRHAGSATLVGGEEAAARLRKAGRRRQRGYGRQGGGCSAVLKGGEEAVSRRRVPRLKRRSCP